MFVLAETSLANFPWNFDFPLFLFLGEWFIGWFMPKRKGFWLRSAISAAVILGFMAFKLLMPSGLDNYWFLFTFLVSLGCIAFTFDGTIWSYLFVGTVGYCVQNLNNEIFYTFRSYTGLVGFYFDLIFLIPLFAAICFLVYYFGLRKKDTAQTIGNINNPIQVLVSLVVIAAISVMGLQVLININSDAKLASLFMQLILIIFDFVTIFFEFEILINQQVKKENEKIYMIWHQEQKTYEISKNNIESFNIKYHDISHRLASINETISSQELADLNDEIKKFQAHIDTNNKVINLVIMEKENVLVENNIRFTCLLDASKLSYIPDFHLYSLFENALSNAIEAVLNLPEEKRVISIRGLDLKDYLTIQISNSFNPDESRFDSTSKQEKDGHGYGLKSIQMLVSQYQGTVNMNRDGEMFSLDILLPVK